MSYIKQTITGLSWIAALRYLSRGLALVQAAVLARFFLSPYEFGLFGIASLVLAFLEIITETGINVFLIQKKEAIDEYISSAWIVSIIRGLIICLLILFSAGWIVSFYSSPDAYPLLVLISIVPFVRGFINPAIVRFQKELNFNKEFYLRTTILLITFIVTLLSAYFLKSSISLVLGLLVGAVIEVLLSIIFIKPIPTISFHFKKVKEVLHHGKWVTLYGIFSYFSQETDDIVLGKMLGVSSLGMYQVAYKLGSLPITEVTDVVQKVVFPLYSKAAANKKVLHQLFIKSSATFSVIIIFFGAVIYLFAGQIVEIILGTKWLEIVPVLQLLIIYGIIRAISGLCIPLFLATGKQRLVAAATFSRFTGLLITIVPFLNIYGINGAAYASLVSAICELPVLGYFLLKEFYET